MYTYFRIRSSSTLKALNYFRPPLGSDGIAIPLNFNRIRFVERASMPTFGLSSRIRPQILSTPTSLSRHETFFHRYYLLLCHDMGVCFERTRASMPFVSIAQTRKIAKPCVLKRQGANTLNSISAQGSRDWTQQSREIALLCEAKASFQWFQNKADTCTCAIISRTLAEK